MLVHRVVARSLALLVLGLCTRSDASILPSFHPDSLAWFADEIVIASEGGRVDGHLEVTSVITGSLRPGDQLAIRELEEFARPAARHVTCASGPCAAHVSGRRMVLFLTRTPGGPMGPASMAGDSTLPAMHGATDGVGGFRVSVAWVEAGEVYAFRQDMNPGPQLLERQMSETSLASLVAAVRAQHAALDAALAIPIVAARIPALLALASAADGTWAGGHARDEAIDAMARSGPAALPSLRALLGDASRREVHPAIVSAIARAGGVSAAPELIAVVTRERAFWVATAPGLAVGWWNGAGLAWGEVERFRAHYMLLLAALEALQPMETRAARPSVSALRSLWRSMPQLEDRSGLDQMSQTCDDVLARIR